MKVNNNDRHELPAKAACIGLAELREYLDSIRPSLRLSEPDSHAWNHYRETGHQFARGCCAISEREWENGIKQGLSSPPADCCPDGELRP